MTHTKYILVLVCNLSPGVLENTVLSASWDATACLWKLDGSLAPLATLSGHEAAVWCVVQLRGGDIVTGSADKSIKIWKKDGSFKTTLTGELTFITK